MDDKLWWYIARSSGLTAWVLVSLTVLWGLVLSTRVLGNRAAPAWLLDLHRALGALTVVFVGVHLTGLVMDEYSAFGPSDILVPLASSFRPAAVAWGVVAMYLLVAIAVTSWTRRWIPDRLWRWVHASAHGVFVLATVHTLTAGTDAGGLFVKVFAVAVGTAYLFLATYRLLAGRRAPVLAVAPAAGSSPARAGSSTVGAAVGVVGAAFHPLTVREVRRETADSVSVSFEVPGQ
ncbi:MAG: hypothetical protein HOQ21_00185, partial [Dermatophilaceae bacterium]|nr:hypothetical protein [Dermatophilaceae bacterium]